MNKIEISTNELKTLYETKKLSTYKIARMFNCCDTTIGKKLKDAKIKRRSPKDKKIFKKEHLEKLYFQKGYSISKIACELNCGHATVWNGFEELGIPKRKNKRYFLSKQKLSAVYLGKKLSQKAIADTMGCSS